MHRIIFHLVGVSLLVLGGWAAAETDLSMAKQKLLQEIRRDFIATAHYTGVREMRDSVSAALTAVPREYFVTESKQPWAYLNRPLPIGHGQTISQPFIVALMTELLDLQAGHRVLEIGTGSGYQAAVLAEIVAEVYSVEIIPELAVQAERRLEGLGYRAVRIRVGDGNLGWPEYAPFDRIIVTAAGRLPSLLVAQLAPGGRLVIPIVNGDGAQMLTVITKRLDGAVTETAKLPVRFVPLTGAN